MTKFNIYGAIVDSDFEKYDQNDLTLKDFTEFVDSIEDNDSVEFNFNSPGGSVASGIAIANKIKALSNRGIKTTAKVEGVCASISTCIACACDKIIMGKGSFFMIHNCWSVVQGDCNTLRKEADVMEKMNSAILSFYRSKFNATDEQLKQWMDEETWITSEDAINFGLICEVEDFGTSYQIAASLKKFNYKKMPEVLNMTIEEEKKVEEPTEEVEKTETVEETPEKPTEEVVEEEKKEDDSVNEEEEKKEDEEEKKEDDEVMNKEEVLSKFAEYEKQIEELTKENEELKKQLEESEKPVEDRLAGLQSSLQKNFNAKMNDLTTELQAKTQELTTIKDEVISLKSKLDDKEAELSETISALQEKSRALDTLNGAVNEQAIELPTMTDGLAKCSTPAQKVAFLKSEKYVR